MSETKNRKQSKAAKRLPDSLPRVDRVTGIYVDMCKEVWVDSLHIDVLLLITTPRLKRPRVIIGKNQLGEEIILYNKADYNRNLARITDPASVKNNTCGVHKLKKELKKFIQIVAKGETTKAREVKTLINIFGADHGGDILHMYHPDYRRIPMSFVKSVLAEYLGDILVVKSEFRPKDIWQAADYLSDQSLQDGLFEVVKESCLTYYNKQKNGGNKA